MTTATATILKDIGSIAVKTLRHVGEGKIVTVNKINKNKNAYNK